MKYIVIMLFLISCTPQLTPEEKLKIRMDEYLGKTKEQVLQGFGFPDRSETIDSMLVIVYQETVTRNMGVYAKQYYKHTFFFFSSFNQTQFVKSWLVKYNELPVNRLDINLMRF